MVEPLTDPDALSNDIEGVCNVVKLVPQYASAICSLYLGDSFQTFLLCGSKDQGRGPTSRAYLTSIMFKLQDLPTW